MLAIVKRLRALSGPRKKWWLPPILILLALMALMAGLAILTEGSATRPFIYAL